MRLGNRTGSALAICASGLCLSATLSFAAGKTPVEKRTWVRGETYLLGKEGDSLATASLESSRDGQKWALSVLKKDKAKKRPGFLAHIPKGDLGKRFYRFREPGTDRVLRQMEVTVLPEAGSPETGPYLILNRKWDKELLPERAGGRARSPKVREFMQAVFRLSKAKGGGMAANSYDKMNKAMADSLSAYASQKNALPIGICHEFFHYVYQDPSSAQRGEYAAVSLGADTSATNIVTFMARPEFVLTNIADPVTAIDIRGDGVSLTLPPNGQAEATLSGSGLKKLAFTIRLASGKTLARDVEIFVRKALSPQEEERRKENLARNYRVEKPDIRFAEDESK
jgi:hypothetical protein